MSVKGFKSLQYLLAPKRIALLGAGNGPATPGDVLLANLLNAGPKGSVYPVHPHKEAVGGIPTYPDVREIPKEIDLAVLAGSPGDILKELTACGEKGIKAALIIASDFHHRLERPDTVMEEIQKITRRFQIRTLGPNSLGIIRPRLGLNVSIAHKCPPPGKLAFVSQSATLATAILDYAADKHVGFSTFVSVGGQVDVDFADLIDFLGLDPETRGIVLYVESIKNGRRFISAARAFARAKPLVVVKGGRYAVSAQVSLTHSGTLAGEDKVYDAVFKRAGMVRVEEILELFHLSEALGKQVPPKGNKLAIVTNAGGPAVMATDALVRHGGSLAELADETLQTLRTILPKHSKFDNPVDVLSDADPERFVQVVKTCIKDRACDGVLAILTPQFATRPVETAEKLVEIAGRHAKRTILACWMGGGEMSRGREVLNRGGVPTYVAPEQGVKSFLYMYNYDRNIRLLYETPSNVLEDFQPDSEKVESILDRAGRNKTFFLGERETKEILEAYGIKSPPIVLTKDPEEALEAARKIGFPVALKVESPDISHKGDVGGVILHVYEEEVKEAFERIRENLARFSPQAEFTGVTVQPMVLWPGLEFAIGAKKDPTFGSVILCGTGGDLFEALQDYAVGLPPLNQTLAKRLLEETKIYRYLKKRSARKVNTDLLEVILMRFSQLIVDFPQIREMDINPFFLGESDGVCLDGRLVLEQDAIHGVRRAVGPCCPNHLAICPYPCHFVDTAVLKNGTPYIIRPIKPEDEPLMRELFHTFSPTTILMRFFQPLTDISHEELARYCQVDYSRETALVASIEEGGRERLIGVGRLTMLPDEESVEMAVVVGDPWHGQGVGSQLCEHVIMVAKIHGVKRIYMDVLRENAPMRGLARKFGFAETESDDPDLIRLVLYLDSQKPKHKGLSKAKRKQSGKSHPSKKEGQS